MEKCGYMDGEKIVDRFQLEKLVDRIGKEYCELMNYPLKNKVDNSRKLLYLLQIGLAENYMQWHFSRKDFSSSFRHEVTVLGYNRNLMESNC
jgi:hypothetical protein